METRRKFMEFIEKDQVIDALVSAHGVAWGKDAIRALDEVASILCIKDEVHSRLEVDVSDVDDFLSRFTS